MTVLNPNDVLFGRGSGPNDHEGNIKFRELVSQRKTEYMATNHRQTKAKIARAIVDTVLNNNGRFLKKVEGEELKELGLPNGVDAYVLADEDTIMEKAKQALRQNRDKGDGKRSPKASPRPVHSTIDHLDLMNRQGPPIVDPGAPVASPTFSRPQMVGNAYGSPNPNVGGIPPPPANDILDTQPIPYTAPGVVGGGGMPEPLPIQNLNVHQDANGDEFATYTTTLSDSPAPKRRDSALYMMQNANNMMSDGTRLGSLGMSVGSFSTGGSRRGSLMGPRMGSRRESIKIDDVWRRDSMMGGGRAESMQMSELMESFKGMSTAGEGEFNSSSDTIGTIEGGGGTYHMSGLSQMSLVSMSSTNSLFRMQSVEEGIGRLSPTPVEGVGGGDKKPSAAVQDPRQFFRTQIGADTGTSNDRGGMPPPDVNQHQQQRHQMQQQTVAASRQSITPQDLFNPRALMASPLESNPSMNFSGEPRRLTSMEDLPDNLSGLGGSSASVLRALGVGGSGAFSSQQSSGLMSFGRTGSSMTASVFDINNTTPTSGSGRILPTERRNG